MRRPDALVACAVGAAAPRQRDPGVYDRSFGTGTADVAGASRSGLFLGGMAPPVLA